MDWSRGSGQMVFVLNSVVEQGLVFWANKKNVFRRVQTRSDKRKMVKIGILEVFLNLAVSMMLRCQQLKMLLVGMPLVGLSK
jgi:hypothetical protein